MKDTFAPTTIGLISSLDMTAAGSLGQRILHGYYAYRPLFITQGPHAIRIPKQSAIAALALTWIELSFSRAW